jgi:hypothetical protein
MRGFWGLDALVTSMVAAADSARRDTAAGHRRVKTSQKVHHVKSCKNKGYQG